MSPEVNLFWYGVSAGVFLASPFFMLAFSVVKYFGTGRYHAGVLFAYSTVATFVYFLHNIYGISTHYALLNDVLPQWFLWLGKVLLPIGLYLNYKMLIETMPLRTSEAYAFWHQSKSLFIVVNTVYLLSAIALLFITDSITTMIICSLLIVINTLAGAVVAKLALESSGLKLAYLTTLMLMAISFAATAGMYAFYDMSLMPDFIQVSTHIYFGVLVLVCTFCTTNFVIDENQLYDQNTRFNIESFDKSIYKAIQKNQLFLEYQPKVRLDTNRPCGMEALVRWQHPTKGRIAPDVFIKVAEQSEIIDSISQWVVEQALNDIKRLIEQGIHLSVSVNFSVNNINQGMADYVIDAIQRHDVPARYLMIEITESLLLEINEEQQSVLHQLQRAGVGISLDDFGAGYSSLRHLDRLGLREVKIDKDLIDHIVDVPRKNIIISILEMCQRLGIEVVAEGVGDKQVKHALMKLQCPIGQGFYIARPMVFDTLMLWLKTAEKSKKSLS